MAREKQVTAQARNFGKVSQEHTERVLASMREAMAEVPKEHRMTVIAGIYRQMGQAHYGVKK